MLKNKYVVVKDTREQDGWYFPEDEYCAGMIHKGLHTADYTLFGLENLLCIERKGSTGEFAHNLTEKRFFNELERMDNFAHSFLILEFDFNDILLFPARSGIPKPKWNRLKMSSKFILRKLTEIDLNYKTKIIFAPHNAIERASLIFKYTGEKYGL